MSGTALLPAGARAMVQHALDRLAFTHTYTRTTVGVSGEDAHGEVHANPAGPVAGLPCRFVDNPSPVDVTPAGFENVNRPTLYVPHGDPLNEGDQVTNVTDDGGTVVFAGPSVVEDLVRVVPGAGGGIWQRAKLREIREL